MSSFLHHLSLSAPLYILVLIGYTLARWKRWPRSLSDILSRFVFNIALPAFLFNMMSDFSSLPPVDARLLIAYFGGCLIVFILGRIVGQALFRLDGVAQSVFALRGVSRWSAAERRALARLIRAKGGRDEDEFLARYAAHPKLQRALFGQTAV